MKKLIVSVIAVLALVSTAGLAADWPRQSGHQPQTIAQQSKPQTPPASVTVEPTVTLVGCLYREDQVPGRKPNLAERAGILEDYILADAAIPSGEGRSGATVGTTGTPPSMPASGNMYKVEKIPDERLKALVGKKVEVTASISPQRRPPGPGSATGAPTPDRGLSPDQINLPELEASSIREISGTCPATPAPPK